MTSLKTPLNLHKHEDEKKVKDEGILNDEHKTRLRTERRYSYRDGCSVIIFLTVIFLSMLFVAFCVTKNYTQNRRVRTSLKMINCCRRRMLIQAIIANLSEEMANDMRMMFEIKEAINASPPPVIPVTIDYNRTKDEPEILKFPVPNDIFQAFNMSFSVFDEIDKFLKTVFDHNSTIPHNNTYVII